MVANRIRETLAALRDSDWFVNVRAGAPIAFGRAVESNRFRVTTGQVAGLFATHLVLSLAWTFVLCAGPRAFYWPGLTVQALWLFSVPFLALLASRESAGDDAGFARATIALLAAMPTCWIFFAVLDLSFGGHDGRMAALEIVGLDNDGLFCLWMVVAFSAALRSALPMAHHRALSLSATYALAAMLSFQVIPVTAIWYTEEAGSAAVADQPERERIDAERVLYTQAGRIDHAVDALLPERPGTIDLYLISFGGDATQDVFRKEAEYVRELFDRRFDTIGRSILLTNHRDTLDNVPIASATNLSAAIEGVATVMNPAEDILFVYLTSHGSKTPYVSIRLPDVPLNKVRPETLVSAIERAGIEYPAIAISACYSGAFVDSLASERALVITSAAADRQSFGCSDDADLTFFGRAFFEHQLEDTRDFVAAFDGAAVLVHDWETADEYTPSLPQIALGDEMRAQLEALTARLDADATRVAQAIH